MIVKHMIIFAFDLKPIVKDELKVTFYLLFKNQVIWK